jgi:hypothetical protein
MAYEERVVTDAPAGRQVVTEEPVAGNRVVERETYVAPAVEPSTVVERRPGTRIVQNSDPVGNAWAASQMIQTIVWSVVVLVLLVVALLALHTYAHLF